jgi:AraC-like DNA-binding protein
MNSVNNSTGVKAGYGLFLSHTASLIAKSNLLYIQHVGHHFFDRGSLYCDRKEFKSIVLLFTIGGKGHLSYRGRNYEITQGQIMIINCFNHNLMRSDPELGWHYKWVHFHGISAEGYFNMIFDKFGPVIDMRNDIATTQDIDQLIDMVQSGDMNIEIKSANIITGILTHIFLNGSSDIRDYKNSLNSRIQAVLDYIGDNYSSKISNNELMKIACYSKPHLYRVFKAMTGYHPHEFIIKYRINMSKYLLKNTDLTVEETAQRIGFESTSNFISTFRKLEGITPTAFRKERMY